MCLSKCLMVRKTIKLRQVSRHCLQLNSFTQEVGWVGLQVVLRCGQFLKEPVSSEDGKQTGVLQCVQVKSEPPAERHEYYLCATFLQKTADSSNRAAHKHRSLSACVFHTCSPKPPVILGSLLLLNTLKRK